MHILVTRELTPFPVERPQRGRWLIVTRAYKSLHLAVKEAWAASNEPGRYLELLSIDHPYEDGLDMDEWKGLADLADRDYEGLK